MTNDTNLHDHPAVRHLLASEFCPTKRGDDGDTYLLTRKPGGWGWSGTSSRVDDDLAHSLLELAARRRLESMDFGIRVFKSVDGKWRCVLLVDDEADTAHLFDASTELEAVLAAYQATVMEEPDK